VGWGSSVIYVASHIGPLEEPPTRTRDLASYLFTAAGIFVFFYAQYRVVPRFIHRDLDRRVGLWQAGGSLALLLIGALNALFPQGKSDLPSSLLFWMTLLGEGVFIGNVIWSYVKDGPAMPILPVAPGVKATPEHVPDESPKNMGWPKSPSKRLESEPPFCRWRVHLAHSGFSVVQVPVPWSGQMHFLPFGCLWRWQPRHSPFCDAV